MKYLLGKKLRDIENEEKKKMTAEEIPIRIHLLRFNVHKLIYRLMVQYRISGKKKEKKRKLVRR